jgi:hypothetical protein
MPAHLVCLFWGALGRGELEHVDCDVIAVCVCQGVDATQLPAVCPCECTTCKRAWWSMGRPRIVDGKVVRG